MPDFQFFTTMRQSFCRFLILIPVFGIHIHIRQLIKEFCQNPATKELPQESVPLKVFDEEKTKVFLVTLTDKISFD